MHGRLLTNHECMRRYMSNNDTCPCCHHGPETIMHMVWDCEELTLFWDCSVPSHSWAKFFSLGLHEWIQFNLSSLDSGNVNLDWPILFGVATYHLWNDRNKLVFNNRTNMPYTYVSMLFL